MWPFIRTIRIHIYFCDTFLLKACEKVTPRSMILRGGTKSAQYDTEGRRTQCSMMLGGDFLTKNLIKSAKSVSEAGLNDEKTGSQKSRWNVPLNRIRKSHMALRSMILQGD